MVTRKGCNCVPAITAPLSLLLSFCVFLIFINVENVHGPRAARFGQHKDAIAAVVKLQRVNSAFYSDTAPSDVPCCFRLHKSERRHQADNPAHFPEDTTGQFAEAVRTPAQLRFVAIFVSADRTYPPASIGRVSDYQIVLLNFRRIAPGTDRNGLASRDG